MAWLPAAVCSWGQRAATVTCQLECRTVLTARRSTGLQIHLLLSIDEQDKALSKAVESGDTCLAEGGCREGFRRRYSHIDTAEATTASASHAWSDGSHV
ncbi:unnamed protein product [Miscanthus lutarioriparius]|uniref:Uncharacterized protein n=1 Tax=Miscanthus lutarioriparius TaxID=422564 RepID=A0A811N6I4_9POAL|nr:unnamed protein product [Miscanthus lutarioriparius]